MTSKMIFIKEVATVDPDTLLPVSVSIYKDERSGALVGIDSSYMANTDEPVCSPYEAGVTLEEEEWESREWVEFLEEVYKAEAAVIDREFFKISIGRSPKNMISFERWEEEQCYLIAAEQGEVCKGIGCWHIIRSGKVFATINFLTTIKES